MIGDSGQTSAELLFLFGTLIIILMISIVFIAGENELTTAMAAARNGAIEGLATSSSAIYPEDTYRDYSNSKTSLLYPYSVKIVNISYSDLGLDKNYDKKKNSVQGLCKNLRQIRFKGTCFHRRQNQL